ncbi:MAG: hypothetical protein DWG76_05450 [Chloroflexi bacterium]|nr:hypothetical protein [Chloroflexota bacterium]MQC26877.1 hypothetical protein [Chloroflexota bacterium]
MSQRFTPIFVVFLFVLAACGNNSPDAARTAAASTLDAQLVEAQAQIALQTSQAEQATLKAELQGLEATNEALRLSGTGTAGAEATFETIEPQLISPRGAACRIGPNAAFAKAADLGAGEAIAVIGRSSDGEWWQVPKPENAGETCWVFWDSDLDFLGDVYNLPFIDGPALPTNTPAPTRPPGISLNFIQENTCSGSVFFMIAVTNTGPETYESSLINLVDVTAGGQLASSDGNNEFLLTRSSCPKGASTLGSGETAYLAIASGAAPNGNTLRVTVRLCTENGLRGNCISSNTQFSN